MDSFLLRCRLRLEEVAEMGLLVDCVSSSLGSHASMSGLFLVWRRDGEAIVITAAADDDGCSSWLDDDSGAEIVGVGSGVMRLFMISSLGRADLPCGLGKEYIPAASFLVCCGVI